jgi:aminoglycoside phosphotransferase (APT) family kinase protein
MPHPEKRDLEHTRARLTEWLTRRFPGSTDLEISSLRAPADTGFSSDTLLFDLERTQQGERRSEGLVMRIQPRGFNVFPSYDLSIQYRVMDALAETDAPVPRMVAAEWGEETLGAPFYLMERLEGWVPSDSPPMHVAGRIAEDLSPAEREAVWWSGLDAMARVHRVDPLALGLGFLDEPERGATPLEQQLHYYDAFFSWGVGDRARYPLIARALAWLRERRPEEGSARLCWGDSRLANQIFSGLECIGLLDWEMVRLGDPVQDLAWWVSTDRCFSEGLDAPRLQGLPDRAATVARWEQRTERRAEHLDYYEVLALMRFSVVMARVALQMKHYEILPPENHFDVTNLASLTLERKLAELA